MKLFLSILLFASVNALAHDDGTAPRIVVEPETENTVTSNNTNFRFQLFDSTKKGNLGDSDLAVTHEKVLHFVVYDPSLKEFQHVHPTFDGTYWNVSLDFNVSGKYWAWAQGQVKGDVEFSTPYRIEVEVANPAWPTPPVLQDLREGVDQNSRARLSSQKVRAGKMVMLDLEFTRVDGSTSEITPYLGAIAHVIAVPPDADELIHVHPMNGNSKNTGMIHATFPRAGIYRLWVEFLDGNALKRVALAVEVVR